MQELYGYVSEIFAATPDWFVEHATPLLTAIAVFVSARLFFRRAVRKSIERKHGKYRNAQAPDQRNEI
jgi:uncharacterized membrane protein YdjX (TVP38/TMEM64 family)